MELLPDQDSQWHEYFSLLSDHELEELMTQASMERAFRLGKHVEEHVLPKMTDIYRRDGLGNLVGTPAHHRKPGETSDVPTARPRD